MFLTGLKDPDLLILEKLSDEDLQNLSLSCKYAFYLCSNEDFWRKRFLLKFGKGKKGEHRTWKNFYFLVVQSFQESEKLNKRLSRIGFRGLEDFNSLVMEKIAKGGYQNLDLIDFFLPKCNFHAANFGMEAATEIGDMDLINFFISKGANTWNRCLGIASKMGNRKLVDFFTSKRTNFLDTDALFWASGLWGAAYSGDMELVSFFVSKGAPLNCGIIAAAEQGHLKIVRFLMEQGYKGDLHSASFTAKRNGFWEIAEYLESFQNGNG